jgi:Ca-activated chloride channel family protein
MNTLGLFREPRFLLLLVLPLALLAWQWSRRHGRLALPFDTRGGSSARAHAGAWLRWPLDVAESVPPLLLALAICLLAGPQSFREPRSKRVLTNIEFCVDVSGSMLAKFGDGDRYDASMAAIDNFLSLRQGDAFGLTFFGSSVLHWTPLTLDASAIRCAPPFMHPGRLPYWFGGTEIGKALLACRKVLAEREEGDRMIVLVTDGYSADLGGGREEEIARDLREHGIAVYAIHVADGQIPDEVVRIAALTGGEAFKPEDTDGLGHIFERIDSMSRTQLEKSQSEAADDFAPWCYTGLGLLGFALLAWFGLRSTPW